MSRPRLSVRLSRRAGPWIIAGLLALTPGCGSEGDAEPPTSAGQGDQFSEPPSPSAPPTQSAPSTMPDFVGEDFEEARRELVGYNAQVTRKDEIAAEPEGTVIAQEPQGGEDFAQRVQLTVAISPPEVPDVAGLSVGEATQRLRRAGFEVVEVPVFDERQPDGAILGQEPPAGARNAGEVRLTVSRRPVVTYLSDLQPVAQQANEYTTGTASTNGEPYTHAVTIGASRYAQTASAEYDLSRDYRRLVGLIGLGDRAVSGTAYKVEIYGDGRQLFSEDVVLGQTKPVDLDISDVLRLEVTATRVSGQGSVVLADVRAQGLESEVDKAATPSPTSGMGS